MANQFSRTRAQAPSAAVWLREVWEVAAQDELLRSLALRVTMTPDRRVGVFIVRCQAVHLVDGRAAGVVAQVDGPYPTAGGESLEAFLLASVTLLCNRLGEIKAVSDAGGI